MGLRRPAQKPRYAELPTTPLAECTRQLPATSSLGLDGSAIDAMRRAGAVIDAADM